MIEFRPSQNASAFLNALGVLFPINWRGDSKSNPCVCPGAKALDLWI
jgi:hypothetical protein